MADMTEKVYLFKASMQMYRSKNQIYREMALKGSSSLYELAKTITGAFDFNLDHSFAFFGDIKNYLDSEEQYTLFKDEGHPISRKEKSVKRSLVHEVFQAGKKMLFLFDYGEEWTFIIECRRIMETEGGKEYPVVTKKHGDAPKQYVYPSDEECSDEEDSDDEECSNEPCEE